METMMTPADGEQPGAGGDVEVKDKPGTPGEVLNAPPWYGEIKDADLKTWAEKNNPKDAESTLKQLRDAQKLIGDPNRISLPKDGDDITQHEIWDKLNVPKEAKDYKLNRPQMPEGMEWDAGLEAKVLDRAAKLRVHPTQLQGLVEEFAGVQVEQFKALKEHQTKEAGELNGLLKEWGAEKDTNVELAKRGAKFLGMSTEEVDALSNGVTGGKLIMQALLKFGKAAREGSSVDGDSSPVIGKEALKAEIDRYNDRIAKGEKLTPAEEKARSAAYQQYHRKG
jgi:hypothetical protein